MFCKKCGSNVSGAESFCQICGERVVLVASVDNDVVNSESVSVEKTGRKILKSKKRKKKVAIIAIILALVALIVTGTVVVVDYMYQFEHQIICQTCGNFVRGNLYATDGKYFRSDDCRNIFLGAMEESVFGEAQLYRYSGEMFSFCSELNMPESDCKTDSDYEIYEWCGDEARIEVRVGIDIDDSASQWYVDKYDYRVSYGDYVYKANNI